MHLKRMTKSLLDTKKIEVRKGGQSMFQIQRKWKIQCQTTLSFGKELYIVYAPTIKHNSSLRGYILAHVLIPLFLPNSIGLAYQGKDIVFKFLIEYTSLRDFGP
jgi:hypothetical protein